MQADLSIYKNKKVFITGHTGFKGGWLVALLHYYGACIKGYALAPEHHLGIYKTVNGDSLCESYIGDIRNSKLLEEELLKFQPDFIFHLAAQPLVRQSYKIPSETFEVNVLGTSYLLDAVRKLEKKCNIIAITTDKVYKNKEWDIAYKEDNELGGFDPYSTSKACMELLVDSYKNSFFNTSDYPMHQKAVVTARAGNVIGGGDFSNDRIIPDLVNSLMNNEKLQIRNPTSIRPWQHVIEPLVGYLKLGLCIDQNPLNYSNAYNFGPALDDHLSVEALVKQSIQIWGHGEYEIFKQDNLHEAGILKLDITLAEKELNWKPKYTAEIAIQKTIEWYKAEDRNQHTQKQILEYINFKPN